MYDFTIRGTINDVETEADARKELERRLAFGPNAFGDPVYFDKSPEGLEFVEVNL